MNFKRMKKAVKQGLCLAVCVLMIFCLAACGEKEEKFPSHTEEFFVNDFSNVIDEADESAIYSRGVALQSSTTAQAVVVTVESTDGMEISEYALELGRSWGVGDEAKDNGIVLILATEDREVYVAVGYGLEGALPDSKTGRILDVYGMPYFESDNFSAGLSAVYTALVNEVYIEYGITTEEGYTPIALVPEYEGELGSSEALRIGISWLVLIVIVALYIGIFGKRGAFIFFGGPHHFGGGGNFRGGGFGGGFGGGGFRGGGGSFGGGGAGRRF